MDIFLLEHKDTHGFYEDEPEWIRVGYTNDLQVAIRWREKTHQHKHYRFTRVEEFKPSLM